MAIFSSYESWFRQLRYPWKWIPAKCLMPAQYPLVSRETSIKNIKFLDWHNSEMASFLAKTAW